MPDPTFIAAVVNNTGVDGATVSVTVPATAAAGDLLIFTTHYSAACDITAMPAGWTRLFYSDQPNRKMAFAYKIAEASDPGAALSFTVQGGKYWLVVYRNVKQTAPIESHVIGAETNSATVTMPSITTVGSRALLLAIGGAATAIGDFGPGMSATRAETDGGSRNAASQLNDEIIVTPSATDIRTATQVSATPSFGVAVVLAPPNVAPNAPTSLSPSGGVTIDRTATQRFSWQFSDPDAGDSQSKYDLQYRASGTTTWTTVSGTTPNQYHDFAAGHFAAGDWEWQVRTYDAQGLVGPYSASAFFTAATPPTAPTITEPVNGATIAQNTATLAWSYPTQQAYQARKVADNAGSPDTATVYYDTGIVESASARSRTLDFPVNNRVEHLQVRIRDGGLWSTWASVKVTVSYTPPAVPTANVLGSNADAAVYVSATHPTPAAGEPTVTSMDVLRRETATGGAGVRIARAIAPTATHIDRAVASGVDYEYMVRANGDNGTSSDSAWAGGTTVAAASGYTGY